MINYLYNAPKYKRSISNIDLLRVECSKAYTKIDFGFKITSRQSSEEGLTSYDDRGVAKLGISKDVHLTLPNKKSKIQLIRINDNHPGDFDTSFDSAHNWHYFSLYFDPIPLDSTVVSIEDSVRNFEFIGIKLDNKKRLLT